MKIMRSACAGVLLASFVAGAAYAQSSDQVSTFGNQTVGLGPIQQMTPLATVGSLAIGIWTPVAPPYDAAANRSGADNPLP
jgi:hypothetical protein